MDRVKTYGWQCWRGGLIIGLLAGLIAGAGIEALYVYYNLLIKI